MGTGTFLLQVIGRVASTIDDRLGSGMRAEYLKDLVTRRLVGFEIQVAPYAVAELQLHQALKRRFEVEAPPDELRFLTDALANPREQQERLGAPFRVIEESREAANLIKREWPVVLMIGNPPHVKDSKGRAEWVEEPRRIPLVPGQPVSRPSLDEFRAVGRYESDLNGMEWYFWRWACWKVFEANQPDESRPDATAGIVAFVTPSSFLNGRAFAGMREYLRGKCDVGWIINLSPEGNRPPGVPGSSDGKLAVRYASRSSCGGRQPTTNRRQTSGTWRCTGRAKRSCISWTPSAQSALDGSGARPVHSLRSAPNPENHGTAIQP